MLLFYQRYGIGRYALLTARKAQLLCSCCLDGDVVRVGADYLSHTLLHGRDVWIHLGALSTDGCIDHQPPGAGGHDRGEGRQHGEDDERARDRPRR